MFLIISRNFHYSHGELDLTTDDKLTLVFVDVKTQKSDAIGDAFT